MLVFFCLYTDAEYTHMCFFECWKLTLVYRIKGEEALNLSFLAESIEQQLIEKIWFGGHVAA
jgi:isoprenylcysteine carboxyl methyltransferase (ICMT) family protein YpbQ